MNEKVQHQTYDIITFWWKTIKNGSPVPENVEAYVQAIEDEGKKYKEDEILADFFTEMHLSMTRLVRRMESRNGSSSS